MANNGEKNIKGRLIRDGVETGLGVAPFTKIMRAIRAKKVKKYDNEEK